MVLLEMNCPVTKQEVIHLFAEFDADQNMKIDIDEFVNFFTHGDHLDFQEQQNIDTFNKIKKARKIGIVDFIKTMNSMPSTFCLSFIRERWIKK